MSRCKKPKGWWRERTYRHFDWPLKQAAAESLVTDPAKVASHAFRPFLSVVTNTPRYKPHKHKTEPKFRPIRYACHSDSAIFAYYGHQLSQAYERHLATTNHNACVLAYRSLGGKTNYHFAHGAFIKIKAMGDCIALAMDIEKFFDSLDHVILKRMWIKILGRPKSLNPDEYAVFKAITHFTWVDRNAVGKLLSVNWKAPGAICTPADFRDKVVPAVVDQKDTNNKDVHRRIIWKSDDEDSGYWREDKRTQKDRRVGIPQGSPISAILANVYLDAFDEEMQALVTKYSGHYMRYADDLLFIIPKDPAVEQEVVLKATTSIRDRYRLEINPTKTERTVFERRPDGKQETISTPSTVLPKDTLRMSLQYLGLEFDGRNILLRSKSVARFYRRMKSAIHITKKVAQAKNDRPPGKFYRRKLYRLYSHLGRRNFYSYAKRASAYCDSPQIHKQLRNHWRIMQDCMNRPIGLEGEMEDHNQHESRPSAPSTMATEGGDVGSQ
jgi:hypothetical protein